jgi:DNA-binding NarL/FixJ family response regulator
MKEFEILIWAVDDNEFHLMELRRILFGYNLKDFQNHVEFFDALKEDAIRPKIVLMDVNMGKDFDLYQGIRNVRSIDENIQIILMTSDIDTCDVAFLLQRKVIMGYVEKTISTELNNVIFKDGSKQRVSSEEALKYNIKEAIKIINLLKIA